jgi:hypothetical protein
LRLVFRSEPTGTGPELAAAEGGEGYFPRALEDALEEWIKPFVRQFLEKYREQRPES